MKAYLLLLPISFLPAVAGILVTRPMWRIRQLPNEAIQGIGLVVMISVLIGCLVPLFSRRHRGCRMRLHPIEPVQPRDFPVLRAAAQHLALPAMPHAQPARAQVQQRTLQTLLPALRPPQPVAHVAVFFGRSLTISRKAVWHLLHPARRTCVWGGIHARKRMPCTPRSRVLECDAPRPGKSWP